MRQIVDANMEEDRVETEQTVGDIDLEDAINLYSYDETERSRYPDQIDSDRSKNLLKLKFAQIYFLHLNGIYDPCDDVQNFENLIRHSNFKTMDQIVSDSELNKVMLIPFEEFEAILRRLAPNINSNLTGPLFKLFEDVSVNTAKKIPASF
jgi:hypothetical protein